MSGAIITYEESGTDIRHRHLHNGYGSGFSPSRHEWRDRDWQAHPTRNLPVSVRTPTRTVAGQPDGRQ